MAEMLPLLRISHVLEVPQQPRIKHERESQGFLDIVDLWPEDLLPPLLVLRDVEIELLVFLFLRQRRCDDPFRSILDSLTIVIFGQHKIIKNVEVDRLEVLGRLPENR